MSLKAKISVSMYLNKIKKKELILKHCNKMLSEKIKKYLNKI